MSNRSALWIFSIAHDQKPKVYLQAKAASSNAGVGSGVDLASVDRSDKEATLNAVVSYVTTLMMGDKKTTGLKSLQVSNLAETCLLHCTAKLWAQLHFCDCCHWVVWGPKKEIAIELLKNGPILFSSELSDSQPWLDSFKQYETAQSQHKKQPWLSRDFQEISWVVACTK